MTMLVQLTPRQLANVPWQSGAGTCWRGAGRFSLSVRIIGRGPSGLFCAIQAAGEGKDVIVLEKMLSCKEAPDYRSRPGYPFSSVSVFLN